MLYIYRRQPSSGAMELADALEAIRFRARQVPIERKVRTGDFVVAWGEHVPAIPGVQILNGAPLRNKFTDAQMLRQAGVPTIEVSQTRPLDREVPVEDPALSAWLRIGELAENFPIGTEANVRSIVARDVANEMMRAASNYLATLNTLAPAPIRESSGDWIGRMNNHVGGNDLLTPPATPDYYSKRERLINEYRIHSFLGHSIRAGIKAPREGLTPHEWIRSWDGGWRIRYDGVSSRQRHRDLAHSAVAALGLQFGAVDIGEKADGTLIVLEVNRAPGLEGGTVDVYANAIERWMSGAWTQREVANG